MDREYYALPMLKLGAGAALRRPTYAQAARVSLESPALEAMTDLARVAPATIRPQAPLAGANQFMIARGVRLLLVGERPLQVATERGVPRAELDVADIMIPAEQIDVLALADLQASRVGHVVETLRQSGRQHALVVDAGRAVCGIFSLSQIARQLGVALQLPTEARSFAEIEAALL